MNYKRYIDTVFAVGFTAAIITTIGKVDANQPQPPQKDNDLFYCDSKGNDCVLVPDDKPLSDFKKLNPPLPIRFILNEKEVRCLARNITQEADPRSEIDRISVAFATINRVKDKRFPNTICGVISQKGAMSWYRNPIKRNAPPLEQDVKLSKRILMGEFINPSGDTTNWYNRKLDSKDSFNYDQMQKTSTFYIKPAGSVHTFIAY